MSNPQNEQELLEGMIEVQRFMKGQLMFLYQALFSLMEDIEPKIDRSLSYTLAEKMEAFLKYRRDETDDHPAVISAIEEGLALLRVRFQHPPKPDS